MSEIEVQIQHNERSWCRTVRRDDVIQALLKDIAQADRQCLCLLSFQEEFLDPLEKWSSYVPKDRRTVKVALQTITADMKVLAPQCGNNAELTGTHVPLLPFLNTNDDEQGDHMEVEETTPLSCDSAEPTASQKQRAEHKNKHASCVYMDRVFVSQCQDAWRIDVGEEWRSQPSFSMETEDEEEAVDRVRAGQESFTDIQAFSFSYSTIESMSRTTAAPPELMSALFEVLEHTQHKIVQSTTAQLLRTLISQHPCGTCPLGWHPAIVNPEKAWDEFLLMLDRIAILPPSTLQCGREQRAVLERLKLYVDIYMIDTKSQPLGARPQVPDFKFYHLVNEAPGGYFDGIKMVLQTVVDAIGNGCCLPAVLAVQMLFMHGVRLVRDDPDEMDMLVHFGRTLYTELSRVGGIDAQLMFLETLAAVDYKKAFINFMLDQYYSVSNRDPMVVETLSSQYKHRSITMEKLNEYCFRLGCADDPDDRNRLVALLCHLTCAMLDTVCARNAQRRCIVMKKLQSGSRSIVQHRALDPKCKTLLQMVKIRISQECLLAEEAQRAVEVL